MKPQAPENNRAVRLFLFASETADRLLEKPPASNSKRYTRKVAKDLILHLPYFFLFPQHHLLCQTTDVFIMLIVLFPPTGPTHTAMKTERR